MSNGKAHPSQKPGMSKGRFAKGLNEIVPSILRDLADKHGTAAANLRIVWPEIVGADYAAQCQPVKISGGPASSRRGGGRTLIVRASRANALELEYATDDLLRRINSYLGPDAISRISIEASDAMSDPVAPATTPAAIVPDAEGLDSIEDAGLKDSLARLQGAIRADRDRD